VRFQARAIQQIALHAHEKSLIRRIADDVYTEQINWCFLVKSFIRHKIGESQLENEF